VFIAIYFETATAVPEPDHPAPKEQERSALNFVLRVDNQA
jgi:hypothetical protein